MTLDSKIPEGHISKKWTDYKDHLKLVAPNNRPKIDIIVVGTGLAGASAAASLGEMGYNVKAFCFQDSPRRAHSIAAQGGINAAKNYQNDGDSTFRLFYDTIKGDTIAWLQHLAKAKNCAITGSLVIEENKNYYNRLVFIFPDGTIQHYDKRHLFTLAGEDKVYTAGKDKILIEYKGFKICPLICYDLRFPVFARNVEDYDILLYVANWPKPRINAWDILLKARAVENMSYVIGVNRTGMDDNGLEYIGHSQVVDFLGNYITEPQESEGVFIVAIDKKQLMETRHKLGFLNDRDAFEIN